MSGEDMAPWSVPESDPLADLREVMRLAAGPDTFDGAAYLLLVPQPPPFARALEVRRTRNTGPPDRRRLDGRRTRKQRP